MKLTVAAAVLCVASGTEVIEHKRGHSAVEEVVEMLKDMLDKSKEDGEAAKEAFEKFKEYCDENSKEKSEDIEDNTKDIKLLSAKIERLQGENGELSVEVGRLHKEIAENEQQREEAESIRNKGHEAFLSEEEDLENAIDQMKEALETLSEVGADQTMGSAEDHEKMMAGFDSAFLSKQTTTEKFAKRVQTALLAAGSILTSAQRTKVDSFLQTKSPFTGSYSSQSGQVVGILKNMRDTFKSNLEDSQNKEEKEQEAFDELIETLTDKYDKMKEAFDEKQETLGSNDGSLSDKKDALREAKQTVADAEEFLSKLLPLCDKKEKEYNLRELELRPKEEKAVAKAVEIIEHEMDSFGDIADQKNAEFVQKHKAGKGTQMVKHGKAVSFLQLSSSSDAKSRKAAARILGSTKRLRPLAMLLEGGNPFETILSGIGKMLKIIVQEGKLDKERKDWCNDERDEKTENLDDKKDDINSLDGDIEELDETIDDPETGLKEQIKKAEDDLDTCRENMKEETGMRREENADYQKDIDTLVQGEEAIKKAKDVLDTFYKALEKHNNDDDDDAFIQVHKAKKEDPDAPEIMEEDFAGQSDKGGEVIDLLQDVYDNMRAQEARCHEDEQEAQHDYEDSMTDFKDEEADLRKSIIKLTKDLKDAEKSLESKHKELTKTEKEKMKLEQYLEKIEPGCDFVVDNFDERESNRESESEALEKAKELLEDSPMFKQAQQAQKEKGMGDCKDTCLDEGDDHAKCKACLAGVSVPGYCVDHGDAEGC